MITFEKERYKVYKPLKEEGWFKKRNEFITATQMVFALSNFCKDENFKAICRGYNIYQTTPYQFYAEKTLTENQKEVWESFIKQAYESLYKAQQYGKEHEEEVAEEGLKMLIDADESFKNAKLIPNGKNIYYIENEFFSATPDYFIEKTDGRKILLECKTISNKQVEEGNKEDIIDKYKIQVITQMLCTGIDEAYIISQIHEGDNVLDYELIKIDFEGFFLDIIQNNIIQASRDCVEWLQNISNGKEKIEPDYNNKNDLVLSGIIKKTIKEIANDAIENIKELEKINKLLKQKKLDYDLLKVSLKLCVEKNITIDDVCIQAKQMRCCYYKIEQIDKNIEKLEKIKERINNGESIISRNGYVKINNIFKAGVSFDNIEE